LAGKLVLANVVLFPIAALAGIAAHLNASELNSKADELNTTNGKNSRLIDTLNNQKEAVAKLGDELARETSVLEAASMRAEKRLFRFGIFSRVFKLLRFRIRGYYYSRDEMIEVEALGRALDKFIDRFDRKETNANRHQLTIAASASSRP
jgi:hypothetical protein